MAAENEQELPGEPELPFDEYDEEWHREHDITATGVITLPPLGALDG